MSTENEIKIIQLQFPDNIRRRPGMFIGSIETPSVLLREVIDNSIDEIYGCPTCDKIVIDTRQEWNIVSDNGRGMPIAMSEEENLTMAEMAVCRINAGSKFNKHNQVAVGQNGVGIKATNALSKDFLLFAKITEDNYDKSIPAVKDYYLNSEGERFYCLHYQYGVKQEEFCSTYEELKERFNLDFPSGMSTVTAFKPDDQIFKSTSITTPSRNLKYLAFIAKYFYGKEGISIIINDNSLEEIYEPYDNIFKTTVETEIGAKISFLVNFDCDSDLNIIDISGSVNSLPVDRGIHIDLVRQAYKDALKQYFNIDHDYIFYGIKINVVVLAGEVDFSSQTKERLTYLEGTYKGDYKVVQPLVSAFQKEFSKKEDYWRGHVNRINELYKSMIEISTIDMIKSMVNISSEDTKRYKSSMPSNVDDATSPNRSECSLYIVEGNSAGGNMVKARDRRYDAIFYLRGKPMNAINASLEALLENPEMNSIISAIGCGINEYHNLENPHFGRIIIATDADADGGNIASMLIAFFCARMQFLVEAGMLYVVETPLFIQGDKVAYLGDEVESIIDKTKPFTRIKGLGELDPEELQDHIFDPTKRRLKQITIENADYAISLMTSTSARRELMERKGIIKNHFEVDTSYL